MIPIDLATGSLDPLRHAVVRANAGTGKTWTIVNGVLLPWLKADPARSLTQTLVVTYTEKAAAELRHRLRSAFEQEAQHSDDILVRERLETLARSIPDAWIGTIHGICLRILRQNPFEAGVPLKLEVVDDKIGLRTTVRDILKRNLSEVSGRDGRTLNRVLHTTTLSEIFDQAVELGLHLLDPTCKLAERLWFTDPSLDDAPDEDLATTKAELSSRLESSIQNVRDPLISLRESSAGTDKRNLTNLLKRLDEGIPFSTDAKQLPWCGTNGSPLAALDHPRVQELMADCIVVGDLWQGIALRLPVERVDRFVRLLASRASSDWKKAKIRGGQVAFSDMPALLRESLSRESMTTLLRERTQLAVVDEFQDTSGVQWDILRTWFLEDPCARGRLVVVGDPKQSIYSFQGADVRTFDYACAELESAGAVSAVLRRTFRTTGPLVKAVDMILLGGDVDWFRPEASPETPGWYTEANRTLPADRPDPPVPRELIPVAALPVGGENLREGRLFYLRKVAVHFQKLHGALVAVPDGKLWKVRELCWNDFAILCQTRKLAVQAFDVLIDSGVPASFVKMEGLFESRIAVELTILFAAIAEEGQERPASRLTRLGRFAGSLSADPADPRAHLRLEHLLVRWKELGAKGLWSPLLRSIREDTGVTDMLRRSPRSARELTDLGHLLHHAQGFLSRGQGGLHDLVDHLVRLRDGRDQAPDDGDLHRRSTDQPSVQVLTMHASKGLEFPVVALLPSRLRAGSGAVERWIGMDAIGRPRPMVDVGNQKPREEMRIQREEEFRRLLYVALTRPKVQLVVPYYLEIAPNNLDPLSNRILDVIPLHSQTTMDLVLSDRPCAPPPQETERIPQPSRPDPDRYRPLGSFTAISRGHLDIGLDGRELRSGEEPATSAVSSEPSASDLPGGIAFGEAVHLLLEDGFLHSDGPLIRVAAPGLVESVLEKHGLDPCHASSLRDLLLRMLNSPLMLPDAPPLVLAHLTPDRARPEVPWFQCVNESGHPAPSDQSVGWMTGSIDLLLEHANTLWVLDWKTNRLDGWTAAQVEGAMRSSAYDVQAQLYARAVADGFPGRSVGMIWIFVRAFLDPSLPHGSGLWARRLEPVRSAQESILVERWLCRRRGGGSR